MGVGAARELTARHEATTAEPPVETGRHAFTQRIADRDLCGRRSSEKQQEEGWAHAAILRADS